MGMHLGWKLTFAFFFSTCNAMKTPTGNGTIVCPIKQFYFFIDDPILVCDRMCFSVEKFQKYLNEGEEFEGT